MMTVFVKVPLPKVKYDSGGNGHLRAKCGNCSKSKTGRDKNGSLQFADIERTQRRAK